MKTVFQAANSVEAHLIKNLLAMSSIESEVFGEHLEGGIGELLASGTIRLMVADQDYSNARKIISDWEMSQPKTIQESKNKKGFGYGSIALSFIVGFSISFILSTTPITNDGIDFNDDGVLDARWEYYGELVNLYELDKNRDGEFDEVWNYDLKGLLKSSKFDYNFDGRHETYCRYKEETVLWCHMDFDNDGFKEYRENYHLGIIKTVSMFNPASKKLKKKQYFDGNRLNRAEIDLDDDGVLETVYSYDRYEEIQR